MQPRNGIQTLDAYRPTFDPHLDIATEVFSHVQCVKTRHSLARVSKLWRDASKPAAAYPLRFDFDAFPDMDLGRGLLVSTACWTTTKLCLYPTRESLDFLVQDCGKCDVCDYAARRGSVRLLKWARENNLAWSARTCCHAAIKGHLPVLQYLHENGCPWDSCTCYNAACNGHLVVLQYLHENGCPWDVVHVLSRRPTQTTGTACSTRWITSARSGRYTPRNTPSTSDEMPLIRSNTR